MYFSGFNEDQAKNGAAEVVLKHYIKSNKMGELKQNENATDTMDISGEDENIPLPWHHVASFAIYKLFSQWEEDPNLVGVSNSIWFFQSSSLVLLNLIATVYDGLMKTQQVRFP